MNRKIMFCVVIFISVIISAALTFAVVFFLVNFNRAAVCADIKCGTGTCLLNSQMKEVCVCPHGTYGDRCHLSVFRVSDIRTECQTGWAPYANFCYKAYMSMKTWHQARDYCRSSGADLLSLHNRSENDFITEKLTQSSHRYWIGLNDMLISNDFVWSDGSDVKYLNMEKPRLTHNEHCVQLSENSQGRWTVNNCYMSSYFICKTEIAPQCSFNRSDYKHLSWIYYDRSCYLFHHEEMNTSLTWINAQAFCGEENASLTTIHSDLEYRFILSQATKFYDGILWIGLNDFKERGVFRWIDGSEPNVIYWNASYPMYRCVGISSKSGLWENANCNDNNGYICERSVKI